MGKWTHRLTNVNPDTQIGDCSECGPGVRLKPRYGKRAGAFRCHTQYYEQELERRRNRYAEGQRPNYRRYRDGAVIRREEREMLFERSGGLCELCKTNPAEHLDHDHISKQARAFLCRSCNVGLGCFRDNLELLEAAVEYLRQHSSPQKVNSR